MMATYFYIAMLIERMKARIRLFRTIAALGVKRLPRPKKRKRT